MLSAVVVGGGVVGVRDGDVGDEQLFVSSTSVRSAVPERICSQVLWGGIGTNIEL
jgi:hypothetical protein